MRCHICDRVLDEPRFNSDHDDYEPCEACLLVIADTLAGYLDTPAAEDDAFGDPFSPEHEGFYEPEYDFT